MSGHPGLIVPSCIRLPLPVAAYMLLPTGVCRRRRPPPPSWTIPHTSAATAEAQQKSLRVSRVILRLSMDFTKYTH